MNAVTLGGIRWTPIEELPPERELVMLTGPSGMAFHTKFLVLGYYDTNFRPPIAGEIRWLDIHNNALTDSGYRATHWARVLQLP